ncbi:MAG: hypothetical protein PHR23_06595 [bacterium]|jgi:hypothetical protein|nr:hypothetical protein [bacterium]
MKNIFPIAISIFVILNLAAVSCAGNAQDLTCVAGEGDISTVQAPKGVFIYSTGANLLKYDFSTEKEELLFSQEEGIKSHKDISNVIYPNYLKSKNRIVFVGYDGPIGKGRIFECDIDGKNWLEVKASENIKQLFISPDGSKISFGRYIKPQGKGKTALPKDYRYQLVIKDYNGLDDNSYERVIADDYSGRGCYWQSNDAILYSDVNSNTVKIALKTGDKSIAVKGLEPVGISYDGKLLLCADRKNIYSVNTDSYTPILLKKFNPGVNRGFVLSPDKRYLIYSKLRAFELFILAETKDLWLYDLNTNKEKLLIKSNSLYSGFWIE